MHTQIVINETEFLFFASIIKKFLAEHERDKIQKRDTVMSDKEFEYIKAYFG